MRALANFTAKHGRSSTSKHVSWFPPPNIWNTSGLYVGQWTEECEKWFQDHVSKIRRGAFQPLSSKDWRARIRNTRVATRLTYNMTKAAADYIHQSIV
jgi:hypothetical protein